MNVSQFLGMRIVSSPLAREVLDEFRIERNPIKKRRRNWRVVKYHIDRPCAFVIDGNVICMHPELIAKLPQATSPFGESPNFGFAP